MANIGPYVTLGAILVIALLVILVAVPLLTRLSFIAEAISLILEGLGEYTEHPRLVWLGCIVGVMLCCGCIIIAVVVGAALTTCGSSNPALLCHVFGR